MTVLLVLCTLIAFLAIDHMIQRKRTQAALAPLALPAGAHPSIQRPMQLPGDVVLATNHTWMRVNPDGTITLGVDGFLSRLMGVIETLSIPRAGDSMIPSFADFLVGTHGRSFRLATPVGGSVIEQNPEVMKDPSLIFSDPYGKGWLVRMKSRKDEIAASSQYIVRRPAEWFREQAGLVRDLIAMSGTQGQPVFLQEGGLPVDGVLQQFDERMWEDFSIAFTVLRNASESDRKEIGK